MKKEADPEDRGIAAWVAVLMSLTPSSPRSVTGRIVLSAFHLFAICGTSAALAPNKPITDCLIDFWQDSAGLPQKSVTVIMQTSDGYLWIGTKGGLARFDGVKFQVYDDTKRDQLKEREVWALAEDDDGSLWIGTYGGGLNQFKNGRFALYSVKEGLPSGFITCLAKAPDGALWIGTLEGLARRKDDRFSLYTKADGLPSNNVTALHIDQEGALWIGTQRGLASYADGRLIDHSQGQSQLAGPISAIAGSGRDVLWIGVWETTLGFGLRRYQEGTVTSFTTKDGLPSDDVTSLSLDNHGALWIGTLDGLCRLRNGRFEKYYSEVTGAGGSGSLERVSLRNIQELAFDREGSLWIGTRFDGLMRLKDSPFSIIAGDDSRGANPDVRTVFEDERGIIWLGTATGVKRIDNGVATFQALPRGLGAHALGQDTEGNLWVGTEEGLFSLRNGRPRRTGDSRLDRQYVSALLGDTRGNLWIGTVANGLFRRTPAGDVERYTPKEGLLGSKVRALAQDRTGGIWVGTKDGGVSCLRAGRFTTYGVSEGLASDAVQAVIVDKEDVVWAGTRQGLARIMDQKVAMITAVNGLPANYFFQIVEDDFQYLWLNFGGGVARVSKTELHAVADGKAQKVKSIVYTSASGMRSTVMTVPNQPVARRARDGRIWFPTAHGAAIVDPRMMARNTVPPPIHIEELRIKGETREFRDGMELSPGEGELEIHYTGLSFVDPELVRFKYILEGHDKKWQDAGKRRVAYYTNLSPGRYRFRVICFNDNGVQSDKEAALSFRLLPHLYETTWFWTLCALAVVGVAFATYLWRVRSLTARQNELTKKVEERTSDLQQEISEHRRTEQKLQEEANERRQAEEEAGRERDLLHALMDNIPDLIYFKDAGSRYQRINRAHANALGLRHPDDAVGKSDHDFYAPEFASAASHDERELMSQGRAILGKVEHDNRSGRWYLVSKVPLPDKSGGFSGLVGISKDITERKQAEEKLERDLQDFLRVVNAVTQGDLTQRGTEGDDTLGRIARSVNQMLEKFAGILTGARDAAFSVSSSASEILAAATQIAKGAQFGSDQVHTTTSAVEQMAASMEQVSHNAEQSADEARRVLEHVREGEDAVNATASGMAHIDDAVSATAEKMRLLENRSKQIFEIIRLIEEIATQSNLLSLNAAIEAAHAGDAGRGFNVVAEEIRRLADRSVISTKEVSEIVEGIVEETRLVLSAMEDGLHEVHAGRRLSERAQQSLKTIQGLVESSAMLAEQISNASREQVQATQTMVHSMQTIANVTQESSAGAMETSKAVKDMVDLSDQLTAAIARFKINVEK